LNEFFCYCRELGQGLIEFKDPRAVKVAVHLHNCILGNKKVKVQKLDMEKHKGPTLESLIANLKIFNDTNTQIETTNLSTSQTSSKQNITTEQSNTNVGNSSNPSPSKRKGFFW
jgi:hypothetical protein